MTLKIKIKITVWNWSSDWILRRFNRNREANPNYPGYKCPE